MRTICHTIGEGFSALIVFLSFKSLSCIVMTGFSAVIASYNYTANSTPSSNLILYSLSRKFQQKHARLLKGMEDGPT
jgi:hypothetical protein